MGGGDYKTFFQGVFFGFWALGWKVHQTACTSTTIGLVEKEVPYAQGSPDFISDGTHQTAKSSGDKSCGSRNIV